MSDPFTNCWFLTGSTASGKTRLGILLAERLGAEIVSMDSMALYRGMDIGTAKPTEEELARVPHHLVDRIEPHEEFSVARYLEEAARTVEGIEARGKTALFVGGTPLYLKSLLRGMFEGPAADWDFRNRIEAEAEGKSADWLHGQLAEVDPPSAERLHPNDRRRIIRALEVYHLLGRPISELQQEHDLGRSADECRVFALHWPRTILHRRIERRTDIMIEEGLLDEVRGLLAADQPLSRTARQAVGYREVIDHFEGKCTLDEAIEQIKAHSRRLARRQETWFRGLSECRTLDVTEPPLGNRRGMDAEKTADFILEQGQKVG